MTVELRQNQKKGTHNPYNRFMYGLKSPESKRQYPKRFGVFLDFIGIKDQSFEDRLYDLYIQSKQNVEWLQDSLIEFIEFQKERAGRDEIKETTIPNYYKPVKLFCDMNNIVANWNIVTRGMPRGSDAANFEQY